LRPSSLPSSTLPYRAVNGCQGFGDVLLPDHPQGAQMISGWSHFGEPASPQPPPAPAAAPSGRTRPTTTTTAPPRPQWDPVAC